MWARIKRTDEDTAGRVALVVTVFLIGLATDTALARSGNIYALLEGFAYIGIAALAVAVVMLAGELDLSLGSVAAVCGILAVWTSGAGLVACILVATAAGAVFGALQGFVIAYSRISSLLVTVATMIGLRGLANLLTTTGETLPIERLSMSLDVQRQIGIFSPFSILALAMFLGVGGLLYFTRFGREIYAFGGDREAATTAGVPRRRPLVLAFMISGGLAGLVGATLSIKSGSATPNAFDLPVFLLPAVTAVLVGGVRLEGGRGNVIGIACGVLVLQTLTTLFALRRLDPSVSTIVTGALLLAVVLVELMHKSGLFSLRGRVLRRG